ncbi:MAG: hypothetical protein QF441_06605 [Bacteriovoracaceae bacterium]|jgi:hypothetical protein|nr:hypothetical protein [Halobacteriovoraceae bacterium]MDP7320261.1 hypothetical protein [Bacteriovoracaceae bacterium]
MRVLFLFFIFISIVSHANANIFDRLHDCKYNCSLRCQKIISKLNKAIKEVDDCSVTQDRSQTIETCKDLFIGQSIETQCIRMAKNANTVKACVKNFVGDAVELQCIKHAIHAETVHACVENFIGESVKLKCIRYGAHAETIRACVKNFIGDDAKLECIKLSSL